MVEHLVAPFEHIDQQDTGYDTSEPALQNYATGNPHFDCLKFGVADVPFLCYLASDRDAISAEAALDRLRYLVRAAEVGSHVAQIFQTARLVELGSEDVTVKAAARDLLGEMKRHHCLPAREPVLLSKSTGWSQLDELLGEVLTDLIAVFGDRLFSCYAVGSAFDGSGVQSSDVDLHLLFKGVHSGCLKEALQVLSKQLGEKHSVDLDLIPFFESDINPWSDVRTKLGGVQIYGDCSPDILVLPPIDDYVRECMHRAYYYMARARRFPECLTFPVSAPDAGDRYYGYNSRVHEDGSPCTKELVVVAGWLSTALVALKARCYVASKSASYANYCRLVADEWTDHLRDVFELARAKWNYRVPEGQDEQLKLAEICRREVEFENHFFRQYRVFLEGEVGGAPPHDAIRALKLARELFPSVEGKADQSVPSFLMPAWQVCTKRRELDPRLVSVDHLIVKVPSLREVGDKSMREAFHRWEEFGVVVFACRDTLNLRYDLLGLRSLFGEVVFHQRSDKATGITSVRNLFKPLEGFAGTTNEMQTPHTDGSFMKSPPGIVALQVEICGLCGGQSTLVFGDALYRYLERNHPTELAKLFDSNAYTIGRGGEACTRPVFWHEQGRIQFAFRCGNGEDLEVAPWARKGFRAIYDFANARENQLRFRLPTNHVLVVDNHRNLHGRTSWPLDTVRCLNRLWLDGINTHPLYPGLGMRIVDDCK